VATTTLTFHLNHVHRHLLLSHSEDFKICNNTLCKKQVSARQSGNSSDALQ
jgi:hypothetical protein